MKRSRVRPRLAALLIALCSCVGLVSLSVAPAWAAGTVTTFPVASPPYFITAGPDGNLWFTRISANAIGRITPAGVFTSFPLPKCGDDFFCVPEGITTGPNGNLWFTLHDRDSVDQMTTSGSLLNGFTYPASGLEGITVGPDGNIWFTELGGSQIGRFVAS